MPSLSRVRRLGRGYTRWVRPTLLFLLVVLSIKLFLTLTVNSSSSHQISPSAAPSSHKDRIFIASIHWNNELIIRSHWNAAVLDLVKHFGAENIYISIVEGGSWDDTKGALRDLDSQLEKMGVERSIELYEETHKDAVERIPGLEEDGWIWTSRGKRELRRIPYLAGIRNRVMDKLRYLAERTDGKEKRSFDKILWLNDVIFTTEDVTTLIGTRNGSYAAVCALDFSIPPLYYDTFALRDISGAKTVTQSWPFFLATESRSAMISNSPVPVKSCWNGMVVFQADPFYSDPPLQFRGIPDDLALQHLEGSECCLIHADNRLTSVHGVWLNPHVRVSYNPQASKHVHPTGPWPGRGAKLAGIWENRWARWTGVPGRVLEKRIVDARIQTWQDEAVRLHQNVSSEDGSHHCIINEMQVLVHNGWAHV